MKKIITLALALCVSASVFADEGMWMVHGINAALEKKMQERGLKLSAGELYNADAPGATVSDAVVSLGFYCSGSIISDEGLLITNHHCAYSDIFALSNAEHNYLEEGYWAMRSDEEIPIPGKEVFFLKRVLDVTGEVEALKAEGKPMGMRKLSYIVEKKYAKETGLEASLYSMWAGEKYYLALYEVYRDLRLVAAPPVCVAAFGGDEDNWEWPQHKCDFTIYRLYTAPDGSGAKFSKDNVPMKSRARLRIASEPLREGDFTMVIGYPGRTNRYSSGAELDYLENRELPVNNALRKGRMEIIRRWMNADPAVRLKYADAFFNLSNVQEMQEGEVSCFKRFGVTAQKKATDARLQEWIDADPERKAKWGAVADSIAAIYEDIGEIECDKAYFRETIFSGSTLTRTLTRMHGCTDGLKGEKRNLNRGLAEMDLRVEKDLMEYAVSTYLSNVDSSFYGPYQKEMVRRFGTDYKALTDYLWEESFITDPSRAALYCGKSQLETDPLWRFIGDTGIKVFNERRGEIKKRSRVLTLQSEYERALYEMNESLGVPQYPEANSSMRISYGVASSLEPHDGVRMNWYTTTKGLLEKHDPTEHDFCLLPEFKSLLERAGNDEVRVDFLTDNDITGGNSGSPVLNAHGELVGLAFDGNKESLASDCSYTPDYNKCVCVDIQYVLWVLKHYAHEDWLLEEIGRK